MEQRTVDMLTRKMRGLKVVCPGRVAAMEPAQGERFPVVIRPRRLTLKNWEELAQCNPAFARRMAAQPRHVDAVARAILRHDEIARERFGDEETLVRYLVARLRR